MDCLSNETRIAIDRARIGIAPENSVREDGADYSAASNPDDGLQPDSNQETVACRGASLGEELRITREIMGGLAADRARRRACVTSRDNPGESGEFDGAPTSIEVPTELASLKARLHLLARAADCDLAEQLALLLAFDRREGWRSAGCSSCVGWMNEHLGIASSTGYERLQVARELESLPTISALFRVGRLSWSKVRLLCRVADAENEMALALAALELSVSACTRLCRNYRHKRSPSADEDDQGAWKAFEQRSLTVRELDPYSMEIRLRLSKDRAAEFLATLELHEETLREDEMERQERPQANRPDKTTAHEPAQTSRTEAASGASSPQAQSSSPLRITARQRRADAALVMAAKSLCTAGEAVVMADRYRVHVSANLESLQRVDAEADAASKHQVNTLELRPILRGVGPIAPSTAQRLCCDAGLSIAATDEAGELVDLGRRQRAWPARLRRAIIAEQGCCQVPGCGATRWLDVHHVVPWQDGGTTCAANAAVVCRRCHVMLHEGGFTLERNTRKRIAERLAPDPQSLGTEVDRDAAIDAVLLVERFHLVPPTDHMPEAAVANDTPRTADRSASAVRDGDQDYARAECRADSVDGASP